MPTFEVINNPEVARLVQFSTGQFNPETKGKLDFQCSRDTGKSRKRKLKVTTEVNNIRYEGENFGQSNHFSTTNCDYYVAVHRKGADKIQILPAELFHLKPQLEDELKQNEQQEKLSFREERNNLIAQFGSGQMQKMVKRHMDNKMDAGVLKLMTQSVPKTLKTSLTATMSTGASTSAEATREQEAGSTSVESTAIPAHNKEAQQPQDIYPLESIIPSWAMEAVSEQSQVFVSSTPEDIAKWSKEKVYLPLVLRLLEGLPSDKEQRQLKSSLIMYLHCLMYSYNLKHFEIRKPGPSTWHFLVKKLLDINFTTTSQDKGGTNRRMRPAHLKDLLLSHILVLLMRICNYCILLDPMVADLKLKIQRLTLHAQTLGFKTKKDSGITMATLTAPIQFPQQRKREFKTRL